MVNDGLQAAEEKMRAADVPDAAIATFRHYYEQLVAGESGMLPDAELEPIEDIPEAGALPHEVDAGAPHRTVGIKLNRGGRAPVGGGEGEAPPRGKGGGHPPPHI